MTEVYLALGSNVGDAHGHIKQAIDLLTTILADSRVAPLYLSKAVGYTDQPDFVNTVITGQTDLKPKALLDRLKEIEQQIGRTPTFRHGPREIDIDIIFYGDLVMDTPRLVIPHPSFRERDFVLQPLYDLNPSLIDPVSGQTVKALLAQISGRQKSLIKQVDAGR
jgi:2-amino-4-hydroxy-6-hydroxymethyldihydropteridine diphosphokinase